MKLLLKKNVPHLGKIGDVVNVKSGYARNYLLPQCVAVQPTAANLRAVEEDKQRYLAELAARKAEFQVQAQALNGKEITISARANEEGHLYGSIGPSQVAAVLAEEGILVDTQYIKLDVPIRQLDKYDVQIEFVEDVAATIHVWVVPVREAGEVQAGESAEAPSEQGEA